MGIPARVALRIENFLVLLILLLIASAFLLSIPPPPGDRIPVEQYPGKLLYPRALVQGADGRFLL